MPKRQTKAEREAAQKAALKQRIADIAAGVNYGPLDENDDIMCAEPLAQFVIALRATFALELDSSERNTYPWNINCLPYFSSVKSTTEFLWERGFRA